MDALTAWITLRQTLLLASYIGMGVLLQKRRLLREEGIHDLTQLVLYLLTPAAILHAFVNVSAETGLFRAIFISLLAAVVTHLLGILLAAFLYRGKTGADSAVLKFALVFSNSGFFTLPLLDALIGPVGVLFGSVYMSVFTLFVWTWGASVMQKEKKRVALSQILLNPNLIAVFLGFFLFLMKWTIADLPLQALRSFSAAYSPLALMVLGAQIGFYKPRRLFHGKALWTTLLLRNLLIPLMVLFFTLLFRPERDLLLASVLPAAAPVAANTVLFATLFRRDVELSTRLVSASTLLGIVSIPLMAALCEILLRCLP